MELLSSLEKPHVCIPTNAEPAEGNTRGIEVLYKLFHRSFAT